MRKEGKRTEVDMNWECPGHLEGVWIASLMVSASIWKRMNLLVIHIWVLDTSPSKVSVLVKSWRGNPLLKKKREGNKSNLILAFGLTNRT